MHDPGAAPTYFKNGMAIIIRTSTGRRGELPNTIAAQGEQKNQSSKLRLAASSLTRLYTVIAHGLLKVQA